MKILFSALLTLLTCAAYAQEKFIEVTVSDTVVAKADILIYKITVADLDPYGAREADSLLSNSQFMENTLNKIRHHFDSLMTVIKGQGYSFLPLSVEDTFAIDASNARVYSRNVLVHSVEALSKLHQLIRNEKGISAMVDMRIENETVYQKMLYKKLIAAATSRAGTVASLSGRQLGKIISVQEKPVDVAGGWTSYPPLSTLSYALIPGWHTTIPDRSLNALITSGPINDFLQIAKTLTVRFAIE